MQNEFLGNRSDKYNQGGLKKRKIYHLDIPPTHAKTWEGQNWGVVQKLDTINTSVLEIIKN